MSFNVDALGGLAEKLKQLVNETQEHYEALVEDSQLYKKGKISEREFFGKIGDYLISSSALNFLAVRVILELKSAMAKGSSIQSPTGASGPTASSSYAPSGSGGGFGIAGFIGGEGKSSPADQYIMPETEQSAPTFKPVDMTIKRDRTNHENSNTRTENCTTCGAQIPNQSKFCNKCGNTQ
jgi:hypothetical protein